MGTGKKPLPLELIQWIIWSILLAMHVLSLLPYDPWPQALVYSCISIFIYLLIIYGNASFLLPRLYERGYRAAYVVCVLFLIPLISFLRFYLNFYVYNTFFAETPTGFRWSGVTSSLITVVLVFISSILFYMALHFFRLRRTQEQLQKRHAEAELNLLKAQVQPHFLFNTLNNIYFVAQRESPATAVLLDQLSQIMRYFVEEAPKEKITLSTEINFIRNYIELEKMRMRYPLQVFIETTADAESASVPPMLLIPLVENVFKHGIDKLRDDNFISIQVSVSNGCLEVSVENRVSPRAGAENAKGTGLRNLQSRLSLLYQGAYGLGTNHNGTVFLAKLNIPL